MSHFFRCQKCLMVSTRPRITFDEHGVCNACQWAGAKKTVNWEERTQHFDDICDRYRGLGRMPDCIVPWSGGKDSIYVANMMRFEFDMTPLLITILPHLETDVGRWNRQNMREGFEYLEIELDEERYRSKARQQFVDHGRPKQPWENAISAVVLQKAVELNIPFVIYGEEGEQEYGGTSREADRWMKPVDKEYLMKYYYMDDPSYELPSDEDFNKLYFTQWSRFENWSPTKHAEFAAEKGMKAGKDGHRWQISDELQDLHMHLAFLKYGFGAYAANMSILIRDGRTTRNKEAGGVDLLDWVPPVTRFGIYQDYFDLTPDLFQAVLDHHVNMDILQKDKYGNWRLKDLAL